MKLSEEQIEKLRQTGIRIDREGRIWHDGTTIEHRGLRRALLRWLDVLPDGRPILRLDSHRYAYVDVEDAFLLVTSARWNGDRLSIRLNDESEEELAYDTLEIGANDALYCRARGGRLPARVLTPAYYAIAEGIEVEGDDAFLRAGGRRHAIHRRASTH